MSRETRVSTGRFPALRETRETLEPAECICAGQEPYSLFPNHYGNKGNSPVVPRVSPLRSMSGKRETGRVGTVTEEKK